MARSHHGRLGLILLLLVLVLSGCGRTTPAAEEPPLVRTETVKADGFSQAANYSGEIRGRYETQLSFQVGGKIIKRNVEVGSVVHDGEPLMEIDTKDILQNVSMSAAQVDSAQSQLSLAEANVARYRQLYAQGAVSSMQLDQYENAFKVAQAAANQASAQYAEGTNQLGYSTLQADSDGVIAEIYAEAGQVVSAGQPVVTLVREGDREMEISVPENRIDEIRNAGPVQVTFWALPDVTVAGKVREISPVADKVTRTYKVRISLVNPPAAVSLGMTANVAVASAANQYTAFIPLSAVYQTGNIPNVWVVQDGAVQLRPIKIGVFGDDKVQVVEGLQDGDIIVTAGVQKLREGQKVRL